MRVVKYTELDIPIEVAFELRRRPSMLRFEAWPLVRFATKLPARWTVGDTVNLRSCRRNRSGQWGKAHNYYVTFTKIDPINHVMVTKEHGGPVWSWQHTISFMETEDGGCILIDTIEIHAWPVTAAVCRFAGMYYLHRQARLCAFADRWRRRMVRKQRK